jgi:hypothetical protein
MVISFYIEFYTEHPLAPNDQHRRCEPSSHMTSQCIGWRIVPGSASGSVLQFAAWQG